MSGADPTTRTGASRYVRRTVHRAGAAALLVDCDDLGDVLALHARLVAEPFEGQTEVIAAASSVLVMFRSPRRAQNALGLLATLDAGDAAGSDARTVTVDVVYDGDDLASLAEHLGITPEQLIETHTATEWVGAFGGFAPGFVYCSATPAPWDVPRLSSPRTAVPAGAVGLAGRFSAVYPRRSPGGWQLIGRTDEKMWDLSREQPALIRPGDTVRYRAVRDTARASAPEQGTDRTEAAQTSEPSADANGPDARGAASGGPALVIDAPGMQTLIEDRGRPGHADQGVPHSGAADVRGLADANDLVGNPSSAAVLEILLGGLRVTASGTQVVALAGAKAPATITAPDGRTGTAPHGRAFALHDGWTLELGEPARGLRTYLAVRGGIDVPLELGSRSADTLSGLGPAPLEPGDRLPIGRTSGLPTLPAFALDPRELPGAGAAATELRVLLGPRQDWFVPEAVQTLTGQDWRVTPDSNRVGVPLEETDGGVLERADDGELPSEGVVAGSLQVPPSGRPVLFLADHPVTGGYPIIGVVHPEDLSAAAQLPPGSTVRFALIDPPADPTSAMDFRTLQHQLESELDDPLAPGGQS